jgi:hypothetical protein
MFEAEEPTSDGAKRAGWRYAQTYPGETFVLRHSGIRAGRWRMLGHHDENGAAVEQFKATREPPDRAPMKYGALAIWRAGVVSRFEQFEVETLVGKTRGEP